MPGGAAGDCAALVTCVSFSHHFPIVVVGSLNADLVVRVERFPAPGETVRGDRFDVFPGGKGGNQAAAAARLGGHVAMVGQVGADAQGTWLRTALAASGADVSRVGIDEHVSSGVALITIDGRGQNQIVIVAGANGTFDPGRLEPAAALLREARVVLLQLEIPMPTVERAAALARAAGAQVLLDPAPAIAVSDQLLSLATVVTPNESELAALTGAANAPDAMSDEDIDALARRLIARGAGSVLVKLGPRGARLVTATHVDRWPAFEVQAVDTTAAGDAFGGALAVALAEGAAPGDAIRFACAAGALSVTRPGAQPSMPTRLEVEDVLSRSGRTRS
jgi:ribokinase